MCTQGHLGEGRQGDVVKWLRKPRSREEEALHTFRKFTLLACGPATVLFPPPNPRGSSPRGSWKPEALSLRAGAEGMGAAAGARQPVPQGPRFQGAAVSCEFRGRRG